MGHGGGGLDEERQVHRTAGRDEAGTTRELKDSFFLLFLFLTPEIKPWQSFITLLSLGTGTRPYRHGDLSNILGIVQQEQRAGSYLSFHAQMQESRADHAHSFSAP